jgi:hypothetical protein
MSAQNILKLCTKPYDVGPNVQYGKTVLANSGGSGSGVIQLSAPYSDLNYTINATMLDSPASEIYATPLTNSSFTVGWEQAGSGASHTIQWATYGTTTSEFQVGTATSGSAISNFNYSAGTNIAIQGTTISTSPTPTFSSVATPSLTNATAINIQTPSLTLNGSPFSGGTTYTPGANISLASNQIAVVPSPSVTSIVTPSITHPTAVNIQSPSLTWNNNPIGGGPTYTPGSNISLAGNQIAVVASPTFHNMQFLDSSIPGTAFGTLYFKGVNGQPSTVQSESFRAGAVSNDNTGTITYGNQSIVIRGSNGGTTNTFLSTTNGNSATLALSNIATINGAAPAPTYTQGSNISLTGNAIALVASPAVTSIATPSITHPTAINIATPALTLNSVAIKTYTAGTNISLAGDAIATQPALTGITSINGQTYIPEVVSCGNYINGLRYISMTTPGSLIGFTTSVGVLNAGLFPGPSLDPDQVIVPTFTGIYQVNYTVSVAFSDQGQFSVNPVFWDATGGFINQEILGCGLSGINPSGNVKSMSGSFIVNIDNDTCIGWSLVYYSSYADNLGSTPTAQFQGVPETIGSTILVSYPVVLSFARVSKTPFTNQINNNTALRTTFLIAAPPPA